MTKELTWILLGLMGLAVVAWVSFGLPEDPEVNVVQEVVQPEESIQEAVDKAQAGDVIPLGEGEWTENLVIDRSITLRGQGADSTVLRAKERDVPAIDISAPEGEEAPEVLLEGLTVTGAYDGNEAQGIRVRDGARVTVVDCSVSDNAWGIKLEDTARAELIGTTVSNSTNGGLWQEGESQSRSKGSYFTGNQIAAYIVDGSATADIRNAEISANGYGLWVVGSGKVHIVDSSVIENREVGMVFTASSRATIEGTTVSENGLAGIELALSAEALVTKSTFADNRAPGMWVEGSARLTVSDTEIARNAGHGVGVDEFGRLTLINCTVTDSRLMGIRIAGSADVRIERTHILRSGGYGVALWEEPCLQVDDEFSGRLGGKDNVIPGPEEDDGNERGSVCPQDIDFLLDEQGGTLDRR